MAPCAMASCASVSTRHSATSASRPGRSAPISPSRPRHRAPPRVPSHSACRAVSAAAPPPSLTLAASSAWRSSPAMEVPSLEAAPSTPRPTGAPARKSWRTGAMPAPSRAFELGQWATAVPVAASRFTAGSSRCTQCASQTSSPSQPSSSAYSVGVRPSACRQYASSSRVSARWVCIRTPSPRASSAASRMSLGLTENGEHGATATRTMAPGEGSWNLRIASCVAARAVSGSSTISSGGSPPADRPRSIEPRQG
jgi:hypothetical protein